MAPDTGGTDNALSGTGASGRSGECSRASCAPPGQRRANRPHPQISTGKAAIWQLHLPWRKSPAVVEKSQEFLDLFARPRRVSGSLLASSVAVVVTKLSPCPGGRRSVP